MNPRLTRPPVQHQRKRSFERLRKILLNQECEEVPLFEIGVDQEIVRAVLGRVPPLEGRNELVRFYWGLGYDYVPVGVSCFQEDPHLPSKEAEDTALLSRGKRSWAPMDGVVKTRDDYEKFPWPDPDRPQTDGIRSLAEQLPDPLMEADGDFNLSYANRAALVAFGLTREHIDAGFNFSDPQRSLRHCDRIPEVQADIARRRRPTATAALLEQDLRVVGVIVVVT